MKVLLGGSALLSFYSVGAMASCTFIPQIMLNNVFILNKQDKNSFYPFRRMQCTLMEGIKTIKACGEILVSHPK